MSEPQLRPHPWWLFWLPSWFWITISPCIYHPSNVDPAKWPAIVAHESVHLRQQAAGSKVWWFLRYIFSGKFRLTVEAEGYAAEIILDRQIYAPLVAVRALDEAAAALAGWPYFWAAPDAEYARQVIV
jgi:hypothetical protein